MNTDKERWAEALLVEKQYGTDAPRFVAERIGKLALCGDQAGVERWLEIAGRLDRLSRAADRKGQA